MSATTVNTFPALHAFNSSRGWFLAAIVLVHLGFFWALTNGLTVYIIDTPDKGKVVLIPQPPRQPPPQTPHTPIDIDVTRIWVPTPSNPPPLQFDDPGPQLVNSDPVPPTLPPHTDTAGPGAGPLIIEPASDPRFPLTEPAYPVSEIRQGHEGTVWLSVQIMPNGRVGAVRVDRSSGYPKLDESAMREARGWRMKPGTSDGTAMAMWTRVPIKFQLRQ
ncbi:MAG TPA: energy transducer TonB [Steroidobacteraceae bacterium]|jgi:protein TonB